MVYENTLQWLKPIVFYSKCDIPCSWSIGIVIVAAYRIPCLTDTRPLVETDSASSHNGAIIHFSFQKSSDTFILLQESCTARMHEMNEIMIIYSEMPNI